MMQAQADNQQTEAGLADHVQGNFSQDKPSDLIIIVDGVGYALHKFPMVAHSGLMRRIIKLKGGHELDDESYIHKMELPRFPGGSQTFDLVARFCYGIHFHIDATNVAALRCAADYLEMTDDVIINGGGHMINLTTRTEAYLKDHVIPSLSCCIQVLKACHALLPFSQNLGIVSRCVLAAADHYNVLCNSQKQRINVLDFDSSAAWAIDEATRELHIDEFHALLSAIQSRGPRCRDAQLSAAVVQYAETWLRDALVHITSQSIRSWRTSVALDLAKAGDEQKRIVEKLVSLIPASDRNVVYSVSFLLAMLKVAILLDASSTCRLNLERRIALQLDEATLDDLLIPNPPNSSFPDGTYNINIVRGAATAARESVIMSSQSTMFDLDSISRIVVNFLDNQQQFHFNSEEDETSSELAEADHVNMTAGSGCPDHARNNTRVMKVVAELLDNFLAEVAPDVNLTVGRFIAFAELLPDYARTTHDGLYRAVDVYLKSHPRSSDLERKKICSLMDCQKLSLEACAHAAQNERLPVQVIVQVLYFQQLRLSRSVINDFYGSAKNNNYRSQCQSYTTDGNIDNEVQYASMQRENLELRIEMTKMKLRLQAADMMQDDFDDNDAAAQFKKPKPAGAATSGLSYSIGKAQAVDELQSKADLIHENENENDENGANLMIRNRNEKAPKSRTFFHSFSKKLGKLNPFSRYSSTSSAENGLTDSRNADVRASRRPRRHSVS